MFFGRGLAARALADGGNGSVAATMMAASEALSIRPGIRPTRDRSGECIDEHGRGLSRLGDANEHSLAEIGAYDCQGRHAAPGCRLTARQLWITFGHSRTGASPRRPYSNSRMLGVQAMSENDHTRRSDRRPVRHRAALAAARHRRTGGGISSREPAPRARGLPPRFRLRFAGPDATLPTSVGLALRELVPLPQRLTAPTWVVRRRPADRAHATR